MKLISLFILSLLTSFSAFGQTDQLITLKGDTLTGKTSVSFNRSTAMQTVTIKNGQDKQHFKIYEVKLLTKGKGVYHTFKINGKYQLALLVKEGYLSIYKIMNSEVSTSTAFEIVILIKKDGSQLVVPNLGFKKYMAKFLSDCKTVAKGFSENAYKKSDLEKIVGDYNNCIAENTVDFNKRKVEINQSPQKVEQIMGLTTTIKKDGNLADLEAVLEMLDDLKNKFDKGSSVPAYLKAALQNSLKNNAAYLDALTKILEE